MVGLKAFCDLENDRSGDDFGALWNGRIAGLEVRGSCLMAEMRVKGRRTTKAMVLVARLANR